MADADLGLCMSLALLLLGGVGMWRNRASPLRMVLAYALLPIGASLGLVAQKTEALEETAALVLLVGLGQVIAVIALILCFAHHHGGARRRD